MVVQKKRLSFLCGNYGECGTVRKGHGSKKSDGSCVVFRRGGENKLTLCW